MSGPIEEISRALPLHEALKEWVPADLWAEYESAQASLPNLSRPCWLNWSGSRQGWLNAQVDFDARRKRLADELRRAQQAIKYHFDGKVRCGELIIYLAGDLTDENPRRLRANAWPSIGYGFNSNQIRAPGGKTLFAYVTQASPEIRQADTECSSEPRPHKSVAGGLAQAAEEEEGPPPRVALELGVHAGVTEFWMAKLALSADQEDGGEFALTGIGFENVFRFSREARGPLDFAWFTAVGAGLDSGATNAVEFGPIVSVSSGSVSLVLNPFFEKTFGENREDGIAFTYAGRLTYELASQLNVGIEAYGEVENLGNAPHVRDQVHRIGPVLYLGTLHGAHSSSHGHSAHSHVSDGHDHKHAKHGHSEWHAEIGFLFGLTQATPDAALKLNVGLEF